MNRPRIIPKQSALLLLLAVLLMAPSLTQAAMERWEIDDSHFAVGFMVDHIGFARVLGMFLQAEGHVFFDPESRELGGGQFVIHTESVFTNHEKRDEHLRGSDFLNVEDFPRMVFRPTGLEWETDRDGRLLGELELLGVSRPVTLDFTLNKVGRYPFPLGGLLGGAPVLGMSLRGTIRRSDWGMDYGLDRGLVGDEIELLLEFEAQRR